MGLPVAGREVAERRAGPETRDRLRALQARLNVRPDEQLMLDEATIAAIDEALAKRGLTAASRTFTVTGTVQRPDGTPRKARVVAFDVDLRGVAAYRQMKTLAETEAHPGFERLADGVSNSRGVYSFTFYDWQYAKAERGTADVVVYTLAPDGARIAGRSRLVMAADYSSTGLVLDLVVTIALADDATEYGRVTQLLRPFLEQSGVNLDSFAGSAEQIAFAESELELARGEVSTVAAAQRLLVQDGELSHELLYGLGRQEIDLRWSILYKVPDADLHAAIAAASRQRIIGEFSDDAVTAFLAALRVAASAALVDDKASASGPRDKWLSAMLSHALKDPAQRASFVHAAGTFKGRDASEFWTKHLPEQDAFKGKPELVAGVLHTQRLTALTRNHQALVEELQVARKVDSVEKLLDLNERDWIDMVRKTGVSGQPAGARPTPEQVRAYVSVLQHTVNAAFPTQRIARMVSRQELPIASSKVSKAVSEFFERTPAFDIAASRVHDFDKEIGHAAGNQAAEVKEELFKIQRVFQVSTTPRAMAVLMERNLHAAYTVANIPRKAFIRTHGQALGGEEEAFAIHERASHIAARMEIAAMHIQDYSEHAPGTIMHADDRERAFVMLQRSVPNYAVLFGSPDLCECGHCRSIYSAAAYFVDLLRFLWRGEPNDQNETPLDVLLARRPDLKWLPLTCENTNTIIPQIDLANEVMEYYAAHGSLTSFKGHDTGEATEAELRANPQHFDVEAYRTIVGAKYPFTLPYHQPLDVIRTYSDHLRVSRYEAMKAVNPAPAAAAARAIAAESLRLSQEDYVIVAGQAFDGTADATAVHVYFGLASANDLESLAAVPELLRRSGLKYVDLVELVKTRFVNSYQDTLDVLDRLFSGSPIPAASLYTKLQQIRSGALNPANDAAITAALAAYNTANGTNVTPAQFGQWVVAHFDEFRQVVTLYEPESRCTLETTVLRTIEHVYTGGASGITAAIWSRIHRFVRLWRKLGWTIHELDLMLAALGAADITPDAIAKLESVAAVKAATRLPMNELAVLWGAIDTYGDRSLYKKLFLNKAVQEIDGAFKGDVWNAYLQNAAEKLDPHRSAIVAAFRLTEDDLAAILAVARVVDNNASRAIDPANDALNLGNLSTIYRHAVLARALKLRVADFCTLLTVFGAAPFSAWNVQQTAFTSIAPDRTLELCRLAKAVKDLSFKVPVLQYILQGLVAPDSTLNLGADKVRRTAKAVHGSFAAIDQSHPDTPPLPLTPEVLSAKLALTFQPEIVTRLMTILDGTAVFETITDANLNVTIPAARAAKYTYVRGSGRLTAAGVMSDGDRAALRGLANATANFRNAVDRLYAAPEVFLTVNFSGVFTNGAQARATLLDHPAQAPAPTLERKLAYVYAAFVPILKRKLRRDAIAQSIAALVGLGQDATGILIAQDVDALVTSLSREGFSATYLRRYDLDQRRRLARGFRDRFRLGRGCARSARPRRQLQRPLVGVHHAACQRRVHVRRRRRRRGRGLQAVSRRCADPAEDGGQRGDVVGGGDGAQRRADAPPRSGVRGDVADRGDSTAVEDRHDRARDGPGVGGVSGGERRRVRGARDAVSPRRRVHRGLQAERRRAESLHRLPRRFRRDRLQGAQRRGVEARGRLRRPAQRRAAGAGAAHRRVRRRREDDSGADRRGADRAAPRRDRVGHGEPGVSRQYALRDGRRRLPQRDRARPAAARDADRRGQRSLGPDDRAVGKGGNELRSAVRDGAADEELGEGPVRGGGLAEPRGRNERHDSRPPARRARRVPADAAGRSRVGRRGRRRPLRVPPHRRADRAVRRHVADRAGDLVGPDVRQPLPPRPRERGDGRRRERRAAGRRRRRSVGMDEGVSRVGSQPQGLRPRRELARSGVAPRSQRVLPGARVVPGAERHHHSFRRGRLPRISREPRRDREPRRLRHAPGEPRQRQPEMPARLRPDAHRTLQVLLPTVERVSQVEPVGARAGRHQELRVERQRRPGELRRPAHAGRMEEAPLPVLA